MRHIKKRYYALVTIGLLLFTTLFFLSAIIKNYINKNSKELVGRRIELSDLSINYLKVAVRASDLMVYESNDVDTFAGFRELYINFDPSKLIGNEYSFSTISLDSLFVNIIQDGNIFNFSDMISPADSTVTEEPDTIPVSPFRFSLYNIKLLHSSIHFYDKNVDNTISLDDLTLDLPLIAWNSESSDVGLEFEFGKQGRVYLGAHVDQLKKEYNVDFKVDKLALENISNYVTDLIDAGGISGFINADLKIKGHMERTSEVLISGETSLETFRLWEPDGSDVFSLESLNVGLQAIDIDKQNFHVSHITTIKPVITANLYKDRSNIERMLLPLMTADSTVIEEASGETNTADSLAIRFTVDQVKVDNGELIFTDHTLYRPFHYDIKEINVTADNIKQDADQVPVKFSVNMNDQGTLRGQSTLSVVNPLNMDLKAEIKRLRLMSFSPYTEFYIARPITQGDFSYDLDITMTPMHMTNTNEIIIKELEFGDKTANEPRVKAPVKLGLYLMKDPKDIISIHMPVEGNPSDPDFSVSKLVWKAFSNLLIKVAASPFNALGNLVGTRPEELENIPVPYAQDSLLAEQYDVLDKIAQILEKKNQLTFSFEQQTDPDEEKAAMSIKLAKKRMLAQSMPLNTAEEIAAFHTRLNEMEDSDEDFVKYIQSEVEGAENMELSKACRILIGEDKLDEDFRHLLINRNEHIRYYLLTKKGIDSTSIEVNTADLRNLPDELRSCNYKVEVSVK